MAHLKKSACVPACAQRLRAGAGLFKAGAAGRSSTGTFQHRDLVLDMGQ